MDVNIRNTKDENKMKQNKKSIKRICKETK